MFRIITIPFNPATEIFDEKPLNDFLLDKELRSHRVEFFRSGEKSYWSILLEYEPLHPREIPRELREFYQRNQILQETQIQEYRQGCRIP